MDIRQLFIPALLAAPLCAAGEQEGEATPAPTPAQMKADQGIEPYAGMKQMGLPLPPAPEEIAALPKETFEAHGKAIKQVLLEQMLRAKDEGRRVTAENLAATAALAEKLQAPSPLPLLLRLEAGGQLSPRAAYALREGLSALFQAYRVDETALRYYVEGSRLPAEALRDSFSWLPVEALFNRIPREKPAFSQMEADFVELGRIAAEATRLYAGIHSREDADAAALALAPLIARREATAPTRFLADDAARKELQKRYGIMTKLLQENLNRQRTRVQKEGFYGSLRLRAADYLFD